ncbi:MAG: hypothetical protein GY698_02245, partial [Actinomycetia bacterium]|nr:hypothetical protein [Actinomycetes bacterium]
MVSLSGHTLDIEGVLHLDIEDVGDVEFVVVKSFKHEGIIGWDMLHKHGWCLDTRTQAMRWGAKLFKIDDGIAGYMHGVDSASSDASFLKDVVNKHRRIFGIPGQLKVAKLPPFQIETEPGKVVHKRAYRTPLAKRAVIDNEIDKML